MDSDEKDEFARVNRVMLSKKSDEYRQRRERNNAAVKKSRHKSKQRTLETQKRVEQLKNENLCLERRLESLSREFNLMKDIFVPRHDLKHRQIQHQQQVAPGLQVSNQPVGNSLQSNDDNVRPQEDSQQETGYQYHESPQQQVTTVLNIQVLKKFDE